LILSNKLHVRKPRHF